MTLKIAESEAERVWGMRGQLSPGIHTITATATDAAANTSGPSNSKTVTIIVV